MKLDKVFENADDLHVGTTILYGKKSDNFVYVDSAMTQKIDAETLLHLCHQGVVVFYDKMFYAPLFYGTNTAKANCTAIHFVTITGGSTVAEVTVNSEEYAA